jgi:hypothetical protein
MLIRITASQYTKANCSGFQRLNAFVSADDLTLRRQNRRHLHQVLLGDTGGTQRILKRFELKFMPSDAFGQEHPLGNQIVDHYLCLLKNTQCHLDISTVKDAGL